MKKNIFIITAIFMMAFASCDSKKEIKSIKSNEFRTEIMTPDIQLVDVRVPEAFNEGHIPGAKNLDFTSEHFDDMMKQLDKKNPVAVYCRGGRQSMEAAEKLQDAGFEVIHLDGGILTWDGEKVYVDDNYVVPSPVTTTVAFGSHNIKAERDGKTVSKNIEVSHVETHGRVSSDKEEYMLTFSSNETFTVNGVSFSMIKVEGGTFSMGATSEQGSDADSDEKPVHSVTLSDYYIGETEVTQELWEAVMGTNPSFFRGSQKPVENVSWNDCKEFITKLNNLTGKNFRLPTEAEWEYASRGGNKSKGYKYSGSNTIGDVAWYGDNSSSTTHNVKTKSPNELGIYDMSGNVWEWCEDWYGSYSSGSQTNPTGPSTGSSRVLRGGSWSYSASYCRVSNRSDFSPGSRGNFLGFRVVCLP